MTLDQELAALAAFGVARARYHNLTRELETIERITGLYLTDGGVDMENTYDGGLKDESSIDFWEMMYSQATTAAGMRAEEAGADINDLLGRVIY